MIRAALALVALACADPTAVVKGRMAADSATNGPSSVVSSFSIDASGGTMYVRLVSPTEDDAQPPYDFMGRMFASADALGARRLVIDLRGISGTDARLAVPLVRGIVKRERFARSGGLVVVIGAKSFSPLQTTAALLGRYAEPRFVSDYSAR